MEWRWWWRRAGPVVLASLAVPLVAQSPPPRPPDFFVTRLQGTTTTESSTSTTQIVPPASVDLSPFPATDLDERPRGADLDGPRRISLSVSRPMPLRELLLLLVNGTPFSIVNDDTVDGTFLGELKDLTMRQALEAVLFPRGLDYDVQGTLVRVFPRRTSTRLFDVNYLNVHRTWRRNVTNAATVDSRRGPNVELATSSESDRFDSVSKGVQALLSASGRMHVDRDAGLVQVTDFSDRLDLVGVYIEAVQLRALRQVRIDAQILDVTLTATAASAIDWKAVRARTGAAERSAGHGAAGIVVADLDVLRRAIAEQGIVSLVAAPQIVAVNNEPAVIRVGTESAYVESAVRSTDRGGNERATKPAALLEGLTLTVTAQVSADGIVLLNVAPSYSMRTGQSKAHDDVTLPVLRISEADTVMRVRDGETIVLSGFLENRQATRPATGFGAMFGAPARTVVKSELVILLTPTIVSPGAALTGSAR
jgi:MSHA biogenesis protein MshL